MSISSLIIGLILFISIPIGSVFGMYIPTSVVFVMRNLWPATTAISIVGLVLGILALRRKTRQRIAIAGIVLNSLVILYDVAGSILVTFAIGC